MEGQINLRMSLHLETHRASSIVNYVNLINQQNSPRLDSRQAQSHERTFAPRPCTGHG